MTLFMHFYPFAASLLRQRKVQHIRQFFQAPESHLQKCPCYKIYPFNRIDWFSHAEKIFLRNKNRVRIW